jgi:hypothetical protein
MDNLGAIAGPCSPWPGRPGRHLHRHRPVIIPGLLAALAVVDAVRHAPEPNGATATRSGSGCDR